MLSLCLYLSVIPSPSKWIVYCCAVFTATSLHIFNFQIAVCFDVCNSYLRVSRCWNFLFSRLFPDEQLFIQWRKGEPWILTILHNNRGLCICNTLRILWEPLQFNNDRGNVIKPFYTEGEASSKIQHRPRRTYKNAITEIQLSKHQEKFRLCRQGFPQWTTLMKSNVKFLTDTRNMLLSTMPELFFMGNLRSSAMWPIQIRDGIFRYLTV